MSVIARYDDAEDSIYLTMKDSGRCFWIQRDGICVRSIEDTKGTVVITDEELYTLIKEFAIRKGRCTI